MYQDSQGKIETVFDQQLDINVTHFISQTSRDTYISGAKSGESAWHNTEDKILRWQFNYRENYVIMVSVNTLDGYRNLIYTSGDDHGNLYYGLGQETINGSWQTITRDLEYDLQRYEPRNMILSVDAFLVRGSGQFAKVELLAALPNQNNILQEEPLLTPSIETPPNEIPAEVITSEPKNDSEPEKGNLPTIILNGAKLIYHKLGEPFFDPGATARDADKHQLLVDILGEVNINQVNRYVLTYIAVDAQGNSVTQTRVVMVYQPGVSQKSEEEASEALSEHEIEAEKVMSSKERKSFNFFRVE